MIRTGLRHFQVQAQISGITADGWQSSRQTRTTLVSAVDAHEATQAVSHLAWDMSAGGYRDRETWATVLEVSGVDCEPIGETTWVRVRYDVYGGIETRSAASYADLKN